MENFKSNNIDIIALKICFISDNDIHNDFLKYINQIYQSTVIFIQVDGFMFWTNILIRIVSENTNILNVKRVIINFNDILINNDMVYNLTIIFPNAIFLIQNWVGDLDKCFLLPIGQKGNIDINIINNIKKTDLFCITWASRYPAVLHIPQEIFNKMLEDDNCIYSFREKYFKSLDRHPELEQYKIPYLELNQLYLKMSEYCFTVCPIGHGYDTYRFWESLINKCIPIVIKHKWYDQILKFYPNIPIIQINTWDDLPLLIPTLTFDLYNTMIATFDINELTIQTWDDKIKHLIK